METDCQQCPWEPTTGAAEPVSSVALPVDSSTALPTPLRFLPLHSLADKSSDLSPNKLMPDFASDPLEMPELPVSPDEATHASPMNDVMARTQVLGIITEPTSVTLDEIREAQSIDDNLQPVIQALMNKVKPPQGTLREYPEEARTLFSQWDSLVLENNVLYRRYHYPDGTTQYLQVVLPVKLRHPYVERLHADLGHFGRRTTCLALAHRTYFLGWRSFTRMLVRTCSTCNMHQRSHQRP